MLLPLFLRSHPQGSSRIFFTIRELAIMVPEPFFFKGLLADLGLGKGLGFTSALYMLPRILTRSMQRSFFRFLPADLDGVRPGGGVNQK